MVVVFLVLLTWIPALDKQRVERQPLRLVRAAASLAA